jgi:hypothetical protein
MPTFLAAVAIEDVTPGLPAERVLERQEQGADAVAARGEDDAGAEIAQRRHHAIKALHGDLNVVDLLGPHRRRQLQAYRAGSLESGQFEPFAPGIAADGDALAVQTQDGSEQVLLGGGVPAAIAIAVNPEPVLRIGQQPVRVPVEAALALQRHLAFPVAARCHGQRATDPAIAEQDRADPLLERRPFRHDRRKRHPPRQAAAGDSILGGNPAVAVRVEIQIDVAWANFIDDNGRDSAASRAIGQLPIAAPEKRSQLRSIGCATFAAYHARHSALSNPSDCTNDSAFALNAVRADCRNRTAYPTILSA